jgi:Uma2 family endonuclease
LFISLNVYVIPRNFGYVTGADGGFKLGVRRSRQPDVGFISKTRLPELPREFKIAPDIAVEVVSENEDIFKKAREYLQAGTHFVWAVYTDEKMVFVCTLDDDGSLRWQPFDISSTLDGGDILPGFTPAVRDIFPE